MADTRGSDRPISLHTSRTILAPQVPFGQFGQIRATGRYGFAGRRRCAHLRTSGANLHKYPRPTGAAGQNDPKRPGRTVQSSEQWLAGARIAICRASLQAGPSGRHPESGLVVYQHPIPAPPVGNVIRIGAFQSSLANALRQGLSEDVALWLSLSGSGVKCHSYQLLEEMLPLRRGLDGSSGCGELAKCPHLIAA